ncbi:hypothetical protein BBJ28_00000354 [Nothophytophthora sp. Chile5]|nr:hypothetical protein BBJ28_00000354 [Nothophytophthora sp. Chile5]
MSTSVLLTFAVIGICVECEGNGDFAPGRSEKDIRYLEREVDFYCKEILRGTTGRPACEVVAAQALYVLGSLLLEKKSNEYATIFWGLNAKLESSVKDLQAKPPVASIAVKPGDQERQRRLLQSKSFSPHCLLLPRACTATGVGSSPPIAVTKSLEHILSTGLEACLNAAVSKVIGVDDLKIAMQIFQLVLPRSRDDPKQCLAVVPVQGEVQGGHGEFDEFEDGMADVWANVDLDELTATWSIDACRPQVLQRITSMSNLRMAVQQLVLHYPPSDDPTFEELYAIDLLGMMLSTCEVQFIWSNVTSTSVKPRNLAPRVLSAALKYNPEKEWLGNVFLKESGAAQELANAWLMGTLDVSALNSTLMPFKVKEAPFSIASGDTLTSDGVRDSNYWVVLTDGIIYHLLRNNPIGFYAMDPLILQFLRGVASKCKFPLQIRANSDGLTDIAVLYDLHLDVFQAFCKSAGEMWHGFAAAPLAHRQEMNQFRTKTMNPQAYKVNFRKVCVSATGGRSYHQMDDSIKSFDKRLAGLTTMFRFMYQCMDAFLFYCGEMAIGDTNLFFDSMELLFRQVNSAEYPQAKKRLARQRSLNQRTGLRNLNEELRKGFCAPAMAFVNSVQLFFARQKYPSLLHWFAQVKSILLWLLCVCVG